MGTLFRRGTPQSLSAGILKGIAKLLIIYGEDIKEDTFKDRLSRISVKEVVRTTKERRPGSMGFAESLLLYYNKKARNPLPWDQLYARHSQKAAEQTAENEKTEKISSNIENEKE